MKKKILQKDNASNMPNSNLGTKGVNKQNAQVHGNRSKQLQHNQEKKK